MWLVEDINRLPCEVLSHIFVLCKRATCRKRGHPDLFCLTVLPAVCRHWRKVALDTKILWSIVTLADNPPFYFSELCLDRSGTATPLDIEIYVSNRFWGYKSKSESEVYRGAMTNALNFIVAHGGTPSRWRNFWLRTPSRIRSIDPQVAALNFIGKSSMPTLERFEIEYDSTHYANIEKCWRNALSNRPLFCDPLPTCLKVARLEWIPNPCLFTEYPQLVGLTRLEIKFPPRLPQLKHIHALLASSPMLEVLSIDTRIRQCNHVPSSYSTDQSQLSINLPKVGLPKVRTLGLLFNTNEVFASWGYNLLLMLDVPNVKYLRLLLESSGFQGRVPVDRRYIQYLTKGPNEDKPKPLFPLLASIELFAESRLIMKHLRNPTEELLEAYPAITTLAVPQRGKLNILNVQPWLVPCLDRLIIPSSIVFESKESIYKRCAAGLGLKTVEVLLPDELGELDERQMRSGCLEVLDGLGVDVCFGYSGRVREVLGFED
ncbi:hypothetical protein RSOLAG1IB_04293 [Rhizoctonia solani AG-1 IB]|uniref:F-box domain-containing protein n=1 Tax=Thanatephorus cucumeris (strain AG1-IB / isolate 7/3/14) TaxID=1108050 RepID=A0A0B7FXV5_THACB|nr:hypothetical protein RSOLAG1IB_04293 [Rhizoctonia solani AG-1 IB]